MPRPKGQSQERERVCVLVRRTRRVARCREPAGSKGGAARRDATLWEEAGLEIPRAGVVLVRLAPRPRPRPRRTLLPRPRARTKKKILCPCPAAPPGPAARASRYASGRVPVRPAGTRRPRRGAHMQGTAARQAQGDGAQKLARRRAARGRRRRRPDGHGRVPARPARDLISPHAIPVQTTPAPSSPRPAEL
jgi:hypothetical protein